MALAQAARPGPAGDADARSAGPAAAPGPPGRRAPRPSPPAWQCGRAGRGAAGAGPCGNSGQAAAEHSWRADFHAAADEGRALLAWRKSCRDAIRHWQSLCRFTTRSVACRPRGSGAVCDRNVLIPVAHDRDPSYPNPAELDPLATDRTGRRRRLRRPQRARWHPAIAQHAADADPVRADQRDALRSQFGFARHAAFGGRHPLDAPGRARRMPGCKTSRTSQRWSCSWWSAASSAC